MHVRVCTSLAQSVGICKRFTESAGVINRAVQKPSKKKTRRVPHYHGEPIVINEDNLVDYLGKAPFDLDRFYKRTPVGVVMGLAWTSMGGSTLYVESNRVSTSTSNSEPTLTVTGVSQLEQLGNLEISYDQCH
jgi:ATP-dependent Lon protease